MAGPLKRRRSEEMIQFLQGSEVPLGVPERVVVVKVHQSKEISGRREY